MRAPLAVLFAALTFAGAFGADEIGVAKAALRDGLWEIARSHAEKAGGAEARLVILESLANEAKWDEVGRRLAGWPDAKGAPYDYYRAVVTGDVTRAVACLLQSASSVGLAEAKMMEANLRVKAGDAAAARRLWADVVSISNASERAFALAAANLGERSALRRAYETVRAPNLKRLVGFRYAVSLLADKKLSADGERIVRQLVKDAPDAPGAREAFVALSESLLAAARWPEAVKAYHEILETWPDAAKVAKVHEGRGWALLKTGRHEEALDAFQRAEKFATDDASRAAAALKVGDTLAEMGRGADAMARYRETIAKYPATDVAEKLRRIVRLRELETKGRELFRGYRFAEAEKVFAEVAVADALRKPRMDYYAVLCLYGQGLDDAAGKGARALAAGCSNETVRADATLWLAKFLYNRSEWKESRRLFAAYADMPGAGGSAPEALTWAARAAFAENDYVGAIQFVTRLVERYPTAPLRTAALLVQAESLVELARFDEAVLVLEGVAAAETAPGDERTRALVLKADALFAMGADNPARYQAALDAYRSVRFGGALSPSGQLTVSFKIARTLEKLKRFGEANDQYYTQVVLAYQEAREKGERLDDEARADFSRAAFRLVDTFEAQGNDVQALNVLKIVVQSDVPAAAEAGKRIERISKKGRFL